MHITLLASGSRGDTQPYLALGLTLRDLGHSVRIAAHENYQNFVTSYGLDYFSIRGDVTQVINGTTAQFAANADNPLKVMISFNKLRKLAADTTEDFFAACQETDAVVYHPGQAVAYYAARQRGIPAILATPYAMTPTGDYPSILFYNGPRLGKAYNRLTYILLQQTFWMAANQTVKDFWKARFGAPPSDYGSVYSRQTSARYPTVVSGSQHVFPRPADWPEHVYQFGYWFLEEEPGWQPPADLQAFLDRGDPPVYVGFGSLGDRARAEETSRLVIQSLRMVGRRGVLAMGWNGLARPVEIQEDIFFLEAAPHSWLFPRMAAVVHHGGAGTTAAGLRAGVPAVILPFGNDQPAWARRVFELGAGARPIPRKRLTAFNLAGALQEALAPETRANAHALGEKIRAEEGAPGAARIIANTLNAA